jgi:hypothetical protein
MVDRPDVVSEPALVLASKAALPEPEAMVGAVTDLGVSRLRALQRDLADELAAAHELLARSLRHGDEIAALEARLTAAEQEVASVLDLELALATAVDERDAALAACNDAHAAIDLVRAEADGARAEVAALRRSTSWRITAPLRRLSDMVRGAPRG